MAEQPTTGELYEAKVVSPEGLRAATDAILAREGSTSFPIAESYTLDLKEAVASHMGTAAILADPLAGQSFKRSRAMTAILLARPVKG